MQLYEFTKNEIVIPIFATGVRDYIHVVDLALGHVAAIKKLEEASGCKVAWS